MRRTSRLLIAAALVGGAASLRAQVPTVDAAAAAARAPGAEIGQEMRRMEQRLIQPADLATLPDIPPPAPPPEVNAAGEATPGVNWAITNVTVRGDAEFLEATGVLGILKKTLVGHTYAETDVIDFLTEYNKRLIDAGFYLVTLWVPPDGFADGVMTVECDAGRVGTRRFAFKSGKGRHFSEKQLARRFRDMHEGEAFNYNEFYTLLYNVNSHPDLTLNTDLRVRKEMTDDGLLQRHVDMDFEIEESLPLHVVWDIDNYGTEATGDWGTGLTLQHINLTKHDDVLTVNGAVSLDFTSLYSLAGSYYIPHRLWQGGAATAYGGYSDLQAEQVVSGIDIAGTGWFAGFQTSLRLIDGRRHLLDGSFGYVYRYIEDALTVQGFETIPRDIRISPFSLALSYSAKEADRLSGRNYLTLEGSYNVGGLMGTSDDVEIRSQRLGAEADYFIGRLQLARIQTFGGRKVDGKRLGRWILFMRVQGQLASGNLIPAEQMGIGGANSVRGYLEREFLGDNAAVGTLELRTPILLGILTRPFTSDTYRKQHEDSPTDRLQFVLFGDAGMINLADPLPGEINDQELLSAGLGFRLAVTQYAQLKFDWGFPLEKTAESEMPGKGHVNLQIQF